ncbi:reverse transcriptase [Ceratobasidium theobromae]|uniref:Reverse transcriptase n=1 Tax=Ceratobasidium theobromae TaxID=1582974 RepID=A0A5N5Q7P3_9AGAM|nr:reverse transcriptase [Ceratobasidium theobromae]
MRMMEEMVGMTGVTPASQEDIESLAKGLIDTMTWATEATMEKREAQCKAPRALWWNEDCSAACSAVVHAKEEQKGREEVWLLTSHLWHSEWSAKRTFFDKICSKAQPNNIWNINQWYRGCKTFSLPTLRALDGSLATTNVEKSELLHRTFFPHTPSTPVGSLVDRMTQEPEVLFPPISVLEVAANLAKCSNKSALGACSSNYQLLCWAFVDHAELITMLYNAMLTFEYHLSCFKNTLIAPIPKPNKFDLASPKAYRPISLLETLSKLFEKIMAKRFMAICGLGNKIPHEQFGGKDMSSCMDTGVALLHDVEKVWQEKRQALMVLLDILGYFNNIDHNLLTHIMEKMGFPT